MAKDLAAAAEVPRASAGRLGGVALGDGVGLATEDDGDGDGSGFGRADVSVHPLTPAASSIPQTASERTVRAWDTDATPKRIDQPWRTTPRLQQPTHVQRVVKGSFQPAVDRCRL